MIVLVTGAASGIGYHLTKKFFLNGQTVFMTDRNCEKLRKSYWEIVNCKGQCAGELYYYPCDVCDPKSICAVLEYVKDIGDLDVLINNAGIAFNEELIQTSIEDWQKLINTNLVGPINLINHFFPVLKKTSGHIVNVSSGQAFFRLPSWGAYSVTKLALGAFSELLSFELDKHRIRVTTVYPFMVNTPFYRDIHGDTLVSKLAMKLIPFYSNTPEYVANKIFNAVVNDKRVEYVNPINLVGMFIRSVPPLANIVTRISNKFLTKGK